MFPSKKDFNFHNSTNRNKFSCGNLISFVTTFDPNFENKQLSIKTIKNFVFEFQEIIGKLFPLESPEERLLNNEEVEALILKFLYDKLMSLVNDVAKNENFNRRISYFRFIRPEHLELKPADVSVEKLRNARLEFQRMTRAKLPRDKLVCVVNACKIIGGLLTFGADQIGYGADDFLPTLIFCLLHSDVKSLFSEIGYIKCYYKRVYRYVAG